MFVRVLVRCESSVRVRGALGAAQVGDPAAAGQRVGGRRLSRLPEALHLRADCQRPDAELRAPTPAAAARMLGARRGRAAPRVEPRERLGHAVDRRPRGRRDEPVAAGRRAAAARIARAVPLPRRGHSSRYLE